MGIGCAIRGSGALWLHPIALGRDAGLALVCPVDTYQYHISIPEVPTPLGLLSPMRGMAVSSRALVEIPIHLGMAWVALVAREAHGRLPLFHHYLFSTFLYRVLGSSLTVPWIPLCISIGTLRLP